MCPRCKCQRLKYLFIFDVGGMVITLCFTLFMTTSLYELASKMHSTISNLFEFMNIQLPNFVTNFSLTWLTCFVKNKFFQSLGTSNTFVISLTFPLFNLMDILRCPIIWFRIIIQIHNLPFSHLLYVTNDLISCDIWFVTPLSKYHVLSLPSWTIIIVTYSLLFLVAMLDCIAIASFSTILNLTIFYCMTNFLTWNFFLMFKL